MTPTLTDRITETIYNLGVSATTATLVAAEIIHIIDTHGDTMTITPPTQIAPPAPPGTTPMYRPEIYFPGRGWDAIPGDDGELRHNRNHADHIIRIARNQNPKLAHLLRVGVCYITDTVEAPDA